MSVVTQSIFKAHSIATFQINSRQAILLLFDRLFCALDLWGRWRAIDFEVPNLAFYKSNLIFTLVSVVPPLVYHFMFTYQVFTSFLHELFAFIFVFQRKFYFSFSLLLLLVIRLEY